MNILEGWSPVTVHFLPCTHLTWILFLLPIYDCADIGFIVRTVTCHSASELSSYVSKTWRKSCLVQYMQYVQEHSPMCMNIVTKMFNMFQTGMAGLFPKTTLQLWFKHCSMGLMWNCNSLLMLTSNHKLNISSQ